MLFGLTLWLQKKVCCGARHSGTGCGKGWSHLLKAWVAIPLLPIREDSREERQGSSRPRRSVPFCPGSPPGGSSVPPSPRHGGLSTSVYPHGNRGRGQKTLCGWRMSPQLREDGLCPASTCCRGAGLREELQSGTPR